VADSLGVGDIACEFPKVEREVGLLPKNQSQLQLGQGIVLFVVTILYMAECF